MFWHVHPLGTLQVWLRRHEWCDGIMVGIPVKDYEPFADLFHPKPNAARAWAPLAKRAGMKYMVNDDQASRGLL
jgi:alpha-L-fucosidase